MSNTLDHILVESLVEQVKGLLAIRAPRDEFANHRVIVHADFTALLDTGVDTNVLMRIRLLILSEESNRRQELARRVFSVDTVLC